MVQEGPKAERIKMSLGAVGGGERLSAKGREEKEN